MANAGGFTAEPDSAKHNNQRLSLKKSFRLEYTVILLALQAIRWAENKDYLGLPLVEQFTIEI